MVVCGVTVEGELYCWGSNERGQFGIGQIEGETLEPVRVADPL
jgi:alpha-tubulin suppressor-like RCC1 family protein